MKIVDSARRLQQAAFPFVEMLAGMAVAQALAVVQVHLSNRELLAALEAAAAAGYLPVPNRNLWPELSALESAFHGGVFFALSVGAGLSLVAACAGAFAAAAGTRRFPVLILWGGLILFVNAEGFSLFPTLYAVFVPPVAFVLAEGGFRGAERAARRSALLTRLLPLGVLALAWSTQYDRELFTAIRDRLLLSNPVGEAVHDYYYRWTLYPAEAFKSPAQKQIRTVRLEIDPAEKETAAVATALAARDVLPVAQERGAQFAAVAAGGLLRFSRDGRPLAETKIGSFLARPDAVLENVFHAADRMAPFRRLVFFTFLFGFPSALYLAAYAFVRIQAAPLLPKARQAEALAALLCFSVAALVLALFVSGRERTEAAGPPPAQIESLAPPAQAAALRALLARGQDLTTVLPDWPSLARSPDPRVRALLARGLAASPSPQAGPVLALLLGDPHLHVRTAAIEATGRRGGRRAREALLLLLERSHTWYDQFYAYRVLRSLGWKQTAAS